MPIFRTAIRPLHDNFCFDTIFCDSNMKRSFVKSTTALLFHEIKQTIFRKISNFLVCNVVMKNKGNAFRKIRPILTHLFNFFKIKLYSFKIINFLRRNKLYNRTSLFLVFTRRNTKRFLNTVSKSEITTFSITITPNFKTIRRKRNTLRTDTIHTCHILENFIVKLGAGVSHSVNCFKCFCTIFAFSKRTTAAFICNYNSITII